MWNCRCAKSGRPRHSTRPPSGGEYGPTCAATITGLQGDASEATRAPLPVIEVEDLAVEQAGGKILRPIFAFPGGRRFHFLDPSGNELAAVMAD